MECDGDRLDRQDEWDREHPDVDDQMEATIDQLQTQYWYLTSEMSWADKQGHIADQEKLRKERLHIVDELLAAGHTGSIDSKLDDFYRW
tara:strand:- start:15 stop:281 length:267 start_codon:yes stop_codon:yes gene_type:complete